MDNLNDIISSLSADDINMLKGVASSILGDDKSNSSDNGSSIINNLPIKKQNINNNNIGNNNALSSLGLNMDDFNMMMKAKSVFDRMNSTTNKNTDLILALKPHLSPANRNKADMAIRILKMFEILPLLKDIF